MTIFGKIFLSSLVVCFCKVVYSMGEVPPCPSGMVTRLTLKGGHSPKPEGRRPFTPEEDKILLETIASEGMDWQRVANVLRTRTVRQCRDRYRDRLAPSIRHTPFSPEEDAFLEKMFNEGYAFKWRALARIFPTVRSPSHIRNRWVSLLRRKRAKRREKRSMSRLRLIQAQNEHEHNAPETVELSSYLANVLVSPPRR